MPTRRRRAERRAEKLCEQVRDGEFAAAFAELSGADWSTVDDRPPLARLRDEVADALTEQAARQYLLMLPAALHTLSIARMTASTMVLDQVGAIHLVTKREPYDDEMGELLHTACGQQLPSDIELPMLAALRGCWQEPEQDTTPCPECAKQAHEFPETSENHLDPNMPAAQIHAVASAVAANTRIEVLEQLEQLRHIEPAAAHNSVIESYREWLLEELSASAEVGGSAVVKGILLRYHDKAAAELREVESPHADDLSTLMTRADWRAVITNVIDDLQHSEDGAVARTYLYTELREVIEEKVRRVCEQAPRQT